MALYGVVSAIHGNAEALSAVLAALERRGATRLLCLGDIVGYNADPDECIALLRKWGGRATCVAGKQDFAATGRLGRDWDALRLPDRTLHALRRTRRALPAPAAQWLAGLPACRALEERVVLAHGGVRDVLQYMTAPRDLRQNADFLAADFPSARLCFFGNSHARRAFQLEGGELAELKGNQVALPKDRLCFVNPGAVDAQRRREHRLAEFALFDTLDWTVEFLRVRYDAATTEAKAAVFGYRVNGLSEGAYRLRRGLARLTLRRGAAPARGGRAA
jgi:predicted phosphodiesterase